MSTQTTVLVETGYAANAQTTQYTSTGLRTIVDKFTGYSPAGGTLTVNLVPSGGAAGAGNIVVVKTFAANETYTFPEVVGHTLAAGDFISTLAGAASTVVIRSSGRQVT